MSFIYINIKVKKMLLINNFKSMRKWKMKPLNNLYKNNKNNKKKEL